jgi:hypothetical protein
MKNDGIPPVTVPPDNCLQDRSLSACEPRVADNESLPPQPFGVLLFERVFPLQHAGLRAFAKPG